MRTALALLALVVAAECQAAPLTNTSYTIKRRPAPTTNAREIALPSNVVIDLTSLLPLTVNGAVVPPTRERSRCPIDPNTAFVDILVYPDGTVVPTTKYSSPSSFGMDSAFIHLWVAERSDLAPLAPGQTTAPLLPLPTGAATTPAGQAFLRARFGADAEIKGEYALVTIFARSGRIAVNQAMPFDGADVGTAAYTTLTPYAASQQGSP
jgi:hypothetical protein